MSPHVRCEVTERRSEPALCGASDGSFITGDGHSALRALDPQTRTRLRGANRRRCSGGVKSHAQPMAKLWHGQQWRGTVSMSLQSYLGPRNLCANKPSRGAFQRPKCHRPSFPSWTSRVRSPSPAPGSFCLLTIGGIVGCPAWSPFLALCLPGPNCGVIVAAQAIYGDCRRSCKGLLTAFLLRPPTLLKLEDALSGRPRTAVFHTQVARIRRCCARPRSNTNIAVRRQLRIGRAADPHCGNLRGFSSPTEALKSAWLGPGPRRAVSRCRHMLGHLRAIAKSRLP
jgi:hypothetical protein